MDGIVISGKPIEQRLVAPRRQVDGEVRGPVGDWMDGGIAAARTAESTVTARKDGAGHRGDDLPFSVAQQPFNDDNCALIRALINRFDGARVDRKIATGGKAAMEFHLLLAMKHLDPVKAAEAHAIGDRCRHRGKRRGVRQYRHRCREDLQCRFGDEAQFARIHRIGTEADTQRVQHHVLFAIRKINCRRELVENVGVVNRHLLLAPKLRFKSKEIQSCCRSLDLCSRRPPPLSIEEKCASCTMHRLGELVDAARAWTANSQAAFVRTYCAINRSVSTPIRNATRAVVMLRLRHRSHTRSGLQFASCPDNLLRINRRAALAHDWSAGPDRSARHHAAPAGQKQQRARDGEII